MFVINSDNVLKKVQTNNLNKQYQWSSVPHDDENGVTFLEHSDFTSMRIQKLAVSMVSWHILLGYCDKVPLFHHFVFTLCTNYLSNFQAYYVSNDGHVSLKWNKFSIP